MRRLRFVAFAGVLLLAISTFAFNRPPGQMGLELYVGSTPEQLLQAVRATGVEPRLTYGSGSFRLSHDRYKLSDGRLMDVIVDYESRQPRVTAVEIRDRPALRKLSQPRVSHR